MTSVGLLHIPNNSDKIHSFISVLMHPNITQLVVLYISIISLQFLAFILILLLSSLFLRLSNCFTISKHRSCLFLFSYYLFNLISTLISLLLSLLLWVIVFIFSSFLRLKRFGTFKRRVHYQPPAYNCFTVFGKFC